MLYLLHSISMRECVCIYDDTFLDAILREKKECVIGSRSFRNVEVAMTTKELLQNHLSLAPRVLSTLAAANSR